MARKRARQRSNPLQIRVKMESLPAGTTPAQYFQGLKRAIRTQELPSDWDVTLYWRNPNTKKGRSKHWQSGEFTEVLQNSRSGFSTVVKRIIDRASRGIQAPPLKGKRPVKKLSKEELHAIRSAASKKGWVTRKKNMAAAAAEAKKEARRAARKRAAAAVKKLVKKSTKKGKGKKK